MEEMSVRDLRKRLGMTQVELAAELGIHQVTVARWETGVRSPSPTIRKLLECMIERRALEAKLARRKSDE